jgi:ankyrin repeat protein
MLTDKEFSPEGLFWAARNNNLDCVRALLRKDNNALDWTGDEFLRSSLYAAAEGGHLDIFRVLLQAGASAAVNECNDTYGGGKTPLIIAAAGGHVEIVTEIMALAHVNPKIADHYKKTAIFFADTVDILEKILKHPDANVKDLDSNGRDILSHACSTGGEEIAKLLVEKYPIVINAADNSGMTPLIRAVCANDRAIVRLLLQDKRIDINKQDNEGRNAISYAAQAPDFQILKSLCKKDASGVTVKDKGSWLPFAWTLSPKQREKNAEYLLQLGGSHLHGKAGLDMFAYTLHPLYRAERIAKLLISAKAFDINTESNNGHTALAWACEQGSPSLVQHVLDAPGIDTHVTGNTIEYLDKVLAERERMRDSQITADIRTLVHAKLK